MALGYGTNTTKQPASNVLYYIDYQYFAKNRYKGESAQAAIMNGYHPGAHSYGPNPCGTWGAGYGTHEDISADIRPFTAWIGKIVTMDTAATGCKNIGPAYTCAAR
jgi:hypothetical protein